MVALVGVVCGECLVGDCPAVWCGGLDLAHVVELLGVGEVKDEGVGEVEVGVGLAEFPELGGEVDDQAYLLGHVLVSRICGFLKV